MPRCSLVVLSKYGKLYIHPRLDSKKADRTKTDNIYSVANPIILGEICFISLLKGIPFVQTSFYVGVA